MEKGRQSYNEELNKEVGLEETKTGSQKSKDLREQAAILQPQLVAMRRELHQYPELSLEEFDTTRRIRTWLAEADVRLLDLDLPTGVLAEVGGEKPGLTIMLRADIDALPVTEDTSLPFASKIPGRMHACGHDFHTASMLGAAILLRQHAKELQGRVRILFQPAEEQAIGARAAIKAGVLNGVSAVLGMHNKPELPVGTIGIRTGSLMAGVDRFEVNIQGKGGHAGMPNTVIDPVVVSSAIVTALQTIVSRNINPLDSAVISICRLEAGSSWNVIPDNAVIEGTVRTFHSDTRQRISELMKRVVEGVAIGYGAKAKLAWSPALPAVNNDRHIVNIVRLAAEDQGLQIVEATPNMGGEDFALYQEQVPGCFVWMGTSGTEQWHHPRFTLNEEALAVSAAFFAYGAIQMLEHYQSQH